MSTQTIETEAKYIIPDQATFTALEQLTRLGNFEIKALGVKKIIDRYLDTNDNGLVDYIEWIIPSLSNQTYELEINILKIDSNPSLFGNWTVKFNTTGTANLTITPKNGTTWNNTAEDQQLKFIEVRCGEEILNYTWIDNDPENSSVLVENYSCNETGYEISKVMIAGKHTLEFRFGDDAESLFLVGIPQS